MQQATHIANPVRVNAARILEWTELPSGNLMLRLSDGRNYTADTSMTVRHCPVVGDYLVTQEDGYEYLNPKDAFERKYSEVSTSAQLSTSGLGFGAALAALKAGKRVARAGWNGKGMFAYLVPANSYPAQTGAAKAFFGEGGMVPYNAYLALKGADDTVSTWAPSGSDALAQDWLVIE